MKHTLCILQSLLTGALIGLNSCSTTSGGTKTTTSTSANGESVTVVETPYEKPFDRELANGIPALMQTQF